MYIEKKIVMSKKVAEDWLLSKLKDLYRLKIYFPFPLKLKKLSTLLKLYRNNKFKVEGVPPISDLGISWGFDYIIIWTTDKENLEKLMNWLEEHGCETSGVI